MKNKSYKLLLVGISVFLSAIIGNALFALKNIDDLTLYQINTRRSYFPHPIARFFSNKLVAAIDDSVEKVFTIFPREF